MIKRYIGSGTTRCSKCKNVIEKDDIGLYDVDCNNKYCSYCIKEMMKDV
jgi:hypothetical protein